MKVATPAPGQSKTFEALRAFLLAILPDGVEVIQAQGNNVPEPDGANFVIMTPVVRQTLSTGLTVYADAAFSASFAGTTMTVSSVRFGTLRVGLELFGAGIAPGTTIEALGTGAGDVGTYVLSAAPVSPVAPFAAGVKRIVQPVQRTIQLDVHSDDLATAGDMAQRISQMFRDEIASDLMAAVDSGVSPLYADDARQTPMVNAEQQYESRWVVDAILQVNEAVEISQQFADDVEFNLYPVA